MSDLGSESAITMTKKKKEYETRAHGSVSQYSFVSGWAGAIIVISMMELSTTGQSTPLDVTEL